LPIAATLPRTPTSAVKKEKGQALYSYNAQRGDELTIHEGEQFWILNKQADGWWMVEFNGITGLVPGNYVSEIADGTFLLFKIFNSLKILV